MPSKMTQDSCRAKRRGTIDQWDERVTVVLRGHHGTLSNPRHDILTSSDYKCRQCTGRLVTLRAGVSADRVLDISKVSHAMPARKRNEWRPCPTLHKARTASSIEISTTFFVSTASPNSNHTNMPRTCIATRPCRPMRYQLRCAWAL